MTDEPEEKAPPSKLRTVDVTRPGHGVIIIGLSGRNVIARAAQAARDEQAKTPPAREPEGEP